MKRKRKPAPKMQRVCVLCFRAFFARREHATTCSNACRQAWYRFKCDSDRKRQMMMFAAAKPTKRRN